MPMVKVSICSIGDTGLSRIRSMSPMFMRKAICQAPSKAKETRPSEKKMRESMKTISHLLHP